MATHDDNGYPVAYGVSHLDGITPVRIRFKPNNSRVMMIDDTTTIAFNPAIIKTQNPEVEGPFATGTSSADDNTVLPWVVNATTGAVLVSD